MGGRSYGVDVNRDGIPDYRVKPGVAVDANGDGIADYRTPDRVRPGPGMNMGPGMHIGGRPMGPPMYGQPGGRSRGVDVNGDGIPDYRVRPGVGVQPGPGMHSGYGGYGY